MIILLNSQHVAQQGKHKHQKDLLKKYELEETIVYLLYDCNDDVSRLTVVSCGAKPMRRISELFTGSTAVKFVSALNKPP